MVDKLFIIKVGASDNFINQNDSLQLAVETSDKVIVIDTSPALEIEKESFDEHGSTQIVFRSLGSGIGIDRSGLTRRRINIIFKKEVESPDTGNVKVFIENYACDGGRSIPKVTDQLAILCNEMQKVNSKVDIYYKFCLCTACTDGLGRHELDKMVKNKQNMHRAAEDVSDLSSSSQENITLGQEREEGGSQLHLSSEDQGGTGAAQERSEWVSHLHLSSREQDVAGSSQERVDNNYERYTASNERPEEQSIFSRMLNVYTELPIIGGFFRRVNERNRVVALERRMIESSRLSGGMRADEGRGGLSRSSMQVARESREVLRKGQGKKQNMMYYL